MDIVDKVFQSLNLSYDADKERAHTASVRQKESLARRKARLGIFGGVAAVVVAGVGLAIAMPRVFNGQTAADSDVTVVFKEDEQPIAELIVKKVENLEAENAKPDDETAQETVAEPAKAVSEEKAVVNAARRNVNSSAGAGKTTTIVTNGTKTETVVHVIDSGEKVDQGTNGCKAVETGSTGVVLWCDEAPTAAPTEDDETDEPEQGEDEVEAED